MYQLFLVGLILLGLSSSKLYSNYLFPLELPKLKTSSLFLELEENSRTKSTEDILLSDSFPPPESSSASNFFKVTAGIGEITSSERHDLVAPGTRENQVGGGYNPISRQLVLDIAGRQVQMTLNQPLVENENITYQITKVVPRFTGSSSVSRFPKLVKNSIIVLSPVTGGGTLSLSGSQITGDFTVRSRFFCGWFEIEENFSNSRTCPTSDTQPTIENGLATGNFRLTVAPGSASDIPDLR